MLEESAVRRIGNPDAEHIADNRRSSPALRITIGVIENDILLREGLVALLNTVDEFDCLGAWNQAPEALIELQRLRPDILVLDVGQMQPSDVILFSRLPSISPATRVFLTMNCPDEWWGALNDRPLPYQRRTPALLSTLQHSVSHVVCYERGFRWIAESIHKAYFGELGIDPAAAEHLAEPFLHSLQLDMTAEKVNAEGLSMRERQVIQLIAQGYSNKDIAREMQLGYSTVKNYVSSILRKLELDGRTQIALLAHRWSRDVRPPLHPQKM